MARIVRIALFVWFLVVFTSYAAPAPLPKRTKVNEGPHPKRFRGDWTLYWCHQTYLYRFHGNGTYEHLTDNWRPNYSGTWHVDNGVLYVRENCEGKFILQHELIWHKGVWTVSELDATGTKLYRLGVIF